MKACGGCTSKLHFLTSAVNVNGQPHAPAALPSENEPPATHLIGDWVGPSVGLGGLVKREIALPLSGMGPPLWSSGQSFWLQIQRSRVRFPALPDFLSSSGSGTGSTQPREIN